MTPSTPVPVSTEARHQAVLALDADAPDAVERVLGFLADPDWRVRKAALARLPALKKRPTLMVELIAGLADDTNAGFRSACGEALRSMGGAVEALVAALHTTHANQRRVVVEILGAMGTEEARGRLLSALDEPDPNTQAAVAEALGNIGGDQVVQALRQRLSGSVGDLHRSAYLLEALARAGARLPMAELAPWLGQRAVVRPVLRLLGLSGERAAVDELVAGLTRSSAGSRRAAIEGLSDLLQRADAPTHQALVEALSAPAPRAALVRALEDPDEDVGAAAARVLGALGDPALAPALLQAAAGRAFLQIALGTVLRLGGACAGPLLSSLHTLDTDARVLALEVIEQLGDASAVPPCMAIARGDDPRSAEVAVRVLARFGDADALEPLVEIVARNDADLLDQAVVALEAIALRHPEAVAKLMLHLLDSERTHWAWLRVLGSTGGLEHGPRILAAMGDPSPEVRAAAVGAAAHLPAAIPARALWAALDDPDAGVRAAAARALMVHPGQGTAEALRPRLADEDPWVVAQAVEALAVAAGQAAVPDLERVARRGESAIVIAAVRSLSRLNPPSLEATVRALLAHPDPEVVREALLACAHLPAASALELAGNALSDRRWEVRRAAAGVLLDRGLRPDPALLEERLAAEDEPLVLEALHPLRALEV